MEHAGSQQRNLKGLQQRDSVPNDYSMKRWAVRGSVPVQHPHACAKQCLGTAAPEPDSTHACGKQCKPARSRRPCAAPRHATPRMQAGMRIKHDVARQTTELRPLLAILCPPCTPFVCLVLPRHPFARSLFYSGGETPAVCQAPGTFPQPGLMGNPTSPG